VTDRVLRNYVAGEWRELDGRGDNRILRNPATDEAIATCPMSTDLEVDQTVEAAAEAFPGWRATPVPDRAAALFRFRERLAGDVEELARIIVRENGKTLADARGELERGIQYVEHACAAPELMKGSHSEDVGTGVDTHYVREPLGPFAVVAPFNFPAMIPLYFAWAVAAGDTVVVKPSELCPLTTIRMVELAGECGFPPGVINVVLGDAGVVQRLATHPDTVGISFVGSSRIAESVFRLASEHGKRAQCQGGAKNHLLVTGSARLDACLGNLMNSAFGQASQRCFAGSNVLVVEEVYDEFMDRFLEAARDIRLGNGLDEGVDMGPVISRESLERLVAEVERAEADGAKVLLDGRGATVEGYPEGYWLGPTVVEAEPGMDVFDEELFGPVRCVRRVADLDEAVSVINRSAFGHSAVIYTESGGAARHFARTVQTGQVGVNVGTPAPIAFYPVGGRKASFYGTLRGRANDAIDFYTDKKVIVSTWHSRGDP
jgi:malonate-semialdehyde dehydrogenase (acetylating) / methylmalonate-semialdehyde dehydrogenase